MPAPDWGDWYEREWRPMVQQMADISDALFGSYDSTGRRQEAPPGMIAEFREHMEYERQEHDAFRALRRTLLVLLPLLPGGMIVAKLLGAI